MVLKDRFCMLPIQVSVFTGGILVLDQEMILKERK